MTARRSTTVVIALLLAASSIPSALAASTPSTRANAGTTLTGRSASHAAYDVTIRRTAGGVPHITANDFGSLGYGVGFAFATDDICTMANDFVTVEGDRSQYFGPGQSYTSYSAGVTLNNLDSDIYWKGVAQSGLITRERAMKTGPEALTPTIKRLLRGYVDGYNRYLASVGGSSGITDPACKGRPWVHPITMTDEYLRIDQLTELASAYVFIETIAEAAPPMTQTPTAALPTRSQVRVMARRLTDHGLGGVSGAGALGSNAIAIGKNGNRDHKHGLLLGNPHFPWQGSERLYQMQLTVPGQMNVEGAGLYGVPLVLVGHTANLAWSHTVSTAYRFVPMQLTLAADSPTSYVIDGKTHKMTSETVQVNNGTSTVSHTLYSSRYGPMITDLQGTDLGWSSTTAYSLFDANAGNLRIIQHFFAVDKAQSVPQLLSILKRDEGLPWVNTIAADRAGHALYADIGSIPNVSDAEAARCNTPFGALAYAEAGLPILNGSKSSCAPATSKQAAAPGIFPPNKLPYLERTDYVTNSNDSFWLSNPQHPLTGFARIIGDEKTPRTLRTRSGLTMTQQRLAGTDGEGKPGFTRGLMQKLEFSDIQYGATLAKSATVAMCKAFAAHRAPTTSGPPVAVGDACTTLARWNGRENINSRGAVLWRAFWEKALNVPGKLWRHAFNPAHAVTTPNTLDTTNHQVQRAFGDALVEMNADHLPFTVKLGRVQSVVRNGVKIPLPGGPGDPDGEFNAIDQNVFDPATRGEDPTIGSSYIQVVTWRSHQHCPSVGTIVTYSESANPNSPYYSDQTRLFSQRKWEHEDFCTKVVDQHATSKITLRGTPS